ncbi:MAG: hypothetical protein IJD70_08715 [Clostridia bacterium]|nr:hypothetical protein [Clostridia bacterium]
MAEIIMSYAFQTIVVILSLFIYTFFISTIFPKIFLSPSYRSVKPSSRGVKKYLFENGRAIVYLPSEYTQKYISQYILSDNGGERYLKCKLNKGISSICYDVVAFNVKNKVIDTLQVNENGISSEISKAVPLPTRTAYVAITVRNVNGAHVTAEPTATFSYFRIGAFIACTAAATVAMSLMLNSLLVYFADLLFGFTASYGEVGNVFAIASALALSLLYCILVLLGHRDRDVRYK